MNTDEQVAVESLAEVSAVGQRHILVGVARQERLHVRRGVDQALQLLGHLQVDILFAYFFLVNPDVGQGAGVGAAMTGIDDDDLLAILAIPWSAGSDAGRTRPR